MKVPTITSFGKTKSLLTRYNEATCNRGDYDVDLYSLFLASNASEDDKWLVEKLNIAVGNDEGRRDGILLDCLTGGMHLELLSEKDKRPKDSLRIGFAGLGDLYMVPDSDEE